MLAVGRSFCSAALFGPGCNPTIAATATTAATTAEVLSKPLCKRDRRFDSAEGGWPVTAVWRRLHGLSGVALVTGNRALLRRGEMSTEELQLAGADILRPPVAIVAEHFFGCQGVQSIGMCCTSGTRQYYGYGY